MRTEGEAALNPGDKVMVDMFNANEKVHVIGTSKGRGFAGFVKRHHFRGGRASHGSMFHRAPGSIGASAYPSRVLKGMRMAGHLGAARVTVQNIRVARVDQENNLLYLRGAVPGPEADIWSWRNQAASPEEGDKILWRQSISRILKTKSWVSWSFRTRFSADPSMRGCCTMP